MEERGRPTKWGGKSARFIELGGHKLDTIITGHLTQEQINAYQQYFRVEEISQAFRNATARGASITHVLPSHKVPTFKRDPSPPPQYDHGGNRTNTRDIRVQTSLEKERHALVELAVTTIKNYDPPVDYKKSAKTSEKLYIPIKDYPDINFVGLLLGPRGNTLRQLQEDSGAKLAIRGKGSVKDGKSTDVGGSSAPEDSLHVVITADTTAKINKAIKLTNEVIEKAISSPVGQNDLKRDQLRELAVLNGTLRETKPYVPPEIFNAQRRSQTRDITQIVCHVCGNVGHYSRDCKLRSQNPGVDSYSPGTSPAPQLTGPIGQKRTLEDEIPPWKRSRMDVPQAPPWATQQSDKTNAQSSQTYYPPGERSTQDLKSPSSNYEQHYSSQNYSSQSRGQQNGQHSRGSHPHQGHQQYGHQQYGHQQYGHHQQYGQQQYGQYLDQRYDQSLIQQSSQHFAQHGATPSHSFGSAATREGSHIPQSSYRGPSEIAANNLSHSTPPFRTQPNVPPPPDAPFVAGINTQAALNTRPPPPPPPPAAATAPPPPKKVAPPPPPPPPSIGERK